MRVLERAGPAAELVSELPVFDERTAVFCRPADAAVVLGSTQARSLLDEAAVARAGLSVARRRSGGGAVVVGPGRQVWLDLFLPADDPLFERDVSAAPLPVGAAWRDALVGGGIDAGELSVHAGALRTTRFSTLACYLGLGPGELVLGSRKMIGLSQRHSRAGAWFFTMAPLLVEPDIEAGLFALPAGERDELAAELRESVAVLAEAAGIEERLAVELARR